MALHVGKVLVALIALVSILSFTTKLDSLNLEINELKIQLNTLNENSLGDKEKVKKLQEEVISARRIISALSKYDKATDEEIEQITEETKQVSSELRNVKNSCRQMIVRDYINLVTRRGYEKLQDSKSLSQFFTKQHFIKHLIALKLKHINLLTDRLEEIATQSILHTGSSNQKDSLARVKTDVIVAVNASLRKVYAQNKRTNTQEDSIRLLLSTAYQKLRTEKLQERKIEGERNSDFINPVESGVIISSFGKQRHPTEPKILIDKNGVEILTFTDESVKAAISGKVTAISKQENHLYTLILKNDSILMVYGNLKDLEVSENKRVSSNEVLGKVGLDESQRPILNFQIWKENQPLNPQGFLKEPF